MIEALLQMGIVKSFALMLRHCQLEWIANRWSWTSQVLIESQPAEHSRGIEIVICASKYLSMNIQQLRLSAGPKIALHTHFVPFSSQNQINKISQIVFDKFPLTLLCLPIMASCTEGGCKIYLISTLIHGTMHITQCNALNNNVLLQMDIFPNSSMNKICLNHITRVTKSASFSTSSTFRFAAYRSAIFKFVMTFRLLSVGQMWSFFGNTWSAIGDLKQNLTPFSGAPH